MLSPDFVSFTLDKMELHFGRSAAACCHATIRSSRCFIFVLGHDSAFADFVLVLFLFVSQELIRKTKDSVVKEKEDEDARLKSLSLIHI